MQHVLLLDRRAEDLRREYLATSPAIRGPGAVRCAGEPRPWMDGIARLMLDAMPPAAAAETTVVVADALSERGMHEAGRVARLHPGIPVFVQTSEGAGTTGVIFDLLHPFQRALLVDGAVPEDTWTRVARHWHECYRLSHPPVPGNPRTLTSRSWESLDEFLRQDNIMQIRSIMTAVVTRAGLGPRPRGRAGQLHRAQRARPGSGRARRAHPLVPAAPRGGMVSHPPPPPGPGATRTGIRS